MQSPSLCITYDNVVDGQKFKSWYYTESEIGLYWGCLAPQSMLTWSSRLCIYLDKLGTLVCKVNQGEIQSPLRHAKLCKTQVTASIRPVSCLLQEACPAGPGSKLGPPTPRPHSHRLLPESWLSEIKILPGGRKIRGLTTLTYCKQDRLGCNWCMGNSLRPLKPWPMQWVALRQHDLYGQ